MQMKKIYGYILLLFLRIMCNLHAKLFKSKCRVHKEDRLYFLFMLLWSAMIKFKLTKILVPNE